MIASPLPRKAIAAAAALVLLGIAGSAGAAGERAASVRFSRFPRRLAPGELVTVGVAVNPVGKVCTLTIVYADAGVQALAPAVAVDGVARWRFHVLADAARGRATMGGECGSAGTVRRSVVVAGSARPAAANVRFSTFPGQLARGELVTVEVAVNPAGKVCTLTIVYADAGVQALAPAVAVGGVALWSFHVLADAAPGLATIVAECGSAGTVRRNVLVAGSAVPAPI